ncbi:MAG: hypothetical protein EOP14_01930 [Pseudomonas sp.]|nr:MAG: hypothetical protein EOP14_01930 [Pseudomonas sp.]
MKCYGSISIALARFGSGGLFGQQAAAQLPWTYLETLCADINGSALPQISIRKPCSSLTATFAPLIV